MPNKGDTTDARIAVIAQGQHGVVTARQLASLGLGRAAISERSASGRLYRVHQGVYAVGHAALSQEARWMAAVLACGDDAVLSHMSAAALWGLLKPEDGPIAVSLPSQSGRRRRKGIRIHRCASLVQMAPLLGISEQRRLAPPLVTARRGIPVTSVPRTVDDLRRGKYPASWVRRARRQAELAGHRLDTPPRRTRSDLEDDFLAFLRRHRLPPPEVNVKVGRCEVDFLWRPQRLVVEPTSTEPTRARLPSRTTTNGTSTSAVSATASAAIPEPKSATTQPWSLLIWAKSCAVKSCALRSEAAPGGQPLSRSDRWAGSGPR